MTRFTIASLLAASIGSPALGDFVIPSSASEGWDRGSTEGSLYAEWDVFTSPFGPNIPDAGEFVGGALPEGFLPFNAFDANESSGSFVPGSGNIYSFSGVIAPQIELPGFGLGDGYATTILVQIRTLGTEIDPTSVLLDEAIEPTEIVELERIDLGDGLGSVQVDTLIRFDAPGNALGYTVNLVALESSMSLDRIAVDAYAEAAGCNAADLAEPSGILDLGDISAFVGAFSTGDLLADLDGNEILDLGDIGAFVTAFTGGCP